MRLDFPIREAWRHDVPKIAALVERMTRNFSESLPIWAYDFSSACETLDRARTQPDTLLLYSGSGFILGHVYELPFNRHTRIATELGWYDERGLGDKLRLAFEEWAAERGADAVDFATIAGHRDEAVGRRYRSAGYKKSEIHYIKILR